jgi:hypothetical protein
VFTAIGPAGSVVLAFAETRCVAPGRHREEQRDEAIHRTTQKKNGLLRSRSQ